MPLDRSAAASIWSKTNATPAAAASLAAAAISAWPTTSDQAAASGGSSAIQLGDDQSDDEFVLDSPGLGSDITRSPGDSGISLLDPSDSGLSLDVADQFGAPPAAGESEFELSGSSGEALGAATDFDSDEVMELKSGDDFLLTPLGSEAEEESEDSGSQVIALDSEASFEETDASMFGSESESMSGMLEEDIGAAAVPLDVDRLGRAAPALATAGVQMVPAGREAPYPIVDQYDSWACFWCFGLVRHVDVRPGAQHVELGPALHGQ